MTDERIFEQDDLRGMTPAEIVDEVAALRAERDQWREIAGRLALLLRENVDACLNYGTPEHEHEWHVLRIEASGLKSYKCECQAVVVGEP